MEVGKVGRGEKAIRVCTGGFAYHFFLPFNIYNFFFLYIFH